MCVRRLRYKSCCIFAEFQLKELQNAKAAEFLTALESRQWFLPCSQLSLASKFLAALESRQCFCTATKREGAANLAWLDNFWLRSKVGNVFFNCSRSAQLPANNKYAY